MYFLEYFLQIAYQMLRLHGLENDEMPTIFTNNV
jgi:hypothetical protein